MQLREGHILVVGQGRAVDHHRRKAHVDAALAGLEAVAVVEVKDDFRMGATEFLGVFHGTLGHIAQQGLVGVVARAFRHLQNDGRLGFHSGHDDGLELFHVVEVEGGDGIAAVHSLGEHFTGVHEP